MKVKDFIEVIRDAEFVCRRNAFAAFGESFKGYEGIATFKLSEFGYWDYAFSAGGRRNFIIIEKDYKIYKTYNKLSELLEDENVMEMEIIKIKKIQLFDDYAQSSTPRNWPDNKSKIEICVR